MFVPLRKPGKNSFNNSDIFSDDTKKLVESIRTGRTHSIDKDHSKQQPLMNEALNTISIHSTNL